jgi:enoyl-CoA hydratase/carnithine racemase
MGIFPSLGLVLRLEHVSGLGSAKRLVLAGEPVDAAVREADSRVVAAV